MSSIVTFSCGIFVVAHVQLTSVPNQHNYDQTKLSNKCLMCNPPTRKVPNIACSQAAEPKQVAPTQLSVWCIMFDLLTSGSTTHIVWIWESIELTWLVTQLIPWVTWVQSIKFMTRLRTQPCTTRLINDCRIMTLICQSLISLKDHLFDWNNIFGNK